MIKANDLRQSDAGVGSRESSRRFARRPRPGGAPWPRPMRMQPIKTARQGRQPRCTNACPSAKSRASSRLRCSSPSGTGAMRHAAGASFGQRLQVNRACCPGRRGRVTGGGRTLTGPRRAAVRPLPGATDGGTFFSAHPDGQYRMPTSSDGRGNDAIACPRCNHKMIEMQACHLLCGNCGAHLDCSDKGSYW